VFLFFFGEKLPFLFTDPRAFSPFKILLIGLCFSAFYAVVRGYFWGNKEFLTPSLLELSEEGVMVVCGVLLLQNIPSAAVGAERAAWAVVLSYLFSFTASLLCFFYRGGRLRSPKKMLKPLFNATLPITSVRMSGSLVNSIVAVLLPWMLLKTGITEGEAIAQFGIVSGMVLPILFIPSTLIGSLALVLVPELSEDFYKKNQQRLQANIQRELRFAFLLSCILIPFYFSLGKPLGMLTFSNQTAGELIESSCFILLPMSLSMISTSILNSMGFEKKTFCFYFIGAGGMLLSILFLPPILGVSAYLVGMLFSFLLTALCNLLYLHKICPIFTKGGGQGCVHKLLLPLLWTLPLSFLGKILHTLFSHFLHAWLALFLTAVLLLVCTLLLYHFWGILPKWKEKQLLFKK
jgi:stage V sporulation protein B